MVRMRFQNRVVAGRATLPMVVAFCTILYFLISPVSPGPVVQDSSVLGAYLQGLIPEGWGGKGLNFVLLGITGFLLREFTIAYSLIKVRSTFQTSTYLLLVLLFPYLFSLQIGTILTPLFYLFLYILFISYQQNKPVKVVFYSLFFIGLISLLFPQILFFLPFIYWGLFNFNALSVKTFFAGIVGVIFPYWFLLGHAFFYDKMDLFYAPFLSLISLKAIDYSFIGIAEYLSLGFILFILLVGIFHYFSFSYQDKIRTRVFLNFLVMLSVAMVTFMFLQPQHINTLVPILLPVTALFTVRFFAFSNSKGANILFIVLLILFISIIGFNIWTL